MKIWEMKLTCITPVHIGNGVFYNPIQYIYVPPVQPQKIPFSSKKTPIQPNNVGKIYFLNESKWFDYLYENGVIDSFAKDLLKKIKSDETLSIHDWLDAQIKNKRLGSCRNFNRSKEISYLQQCGAVYPPEPVYLGSKPKKSRDELGSDQEQKTKNTINNVLPFIRSSNGKCYIPGSSIKGAIRTALLAYDIKQNPDKYEGCWHKAVTFSKEMSQLNDELEEVNFQLAELQKKQQKEGDDFEKEKELKSQADGIEEQLKKLFVKINKLTDEIQKMFSHLEKHEAGYNKRNDALNDLFKYLQVSDASTVKPLKTDKPLEMCVVQKVDLGVKKRNTLPLFRECIVPNNVLSFTISVDDKAIERLGASRIEDILKALRDFADLQYDLQADVYDCIKNVDPREALEQLRDSNLVLGGGAGYLSKTIMYALAVSQTKNNTEGMEDTEQGRRNGVSIVQELMRKQFNKGGHGNEYKLSPHTLKLTSYDEKYVLMGLCKVEMVQELC